MAVTENTVLMTGVDESGNKRLIYPVTTLDAIDGAENLVRGDIAQDLDAEKKAQARENIGAAAADHSHSGYAASGHSHSYNDLTDKPTIPTIPASLPANGGNADTVDGKHAADFAAATHTHDEYAAADHEHAEQVAMHGITTAGDGSSYTATVAGIDALVAGASFIMIPHTTSTVVMPKLNVNGLGAKNIRRRVSNSTVTTVPSVSTNWLYANKPIRMTYDGTYWIADMDRPNAVDIYGTLAIENGGTGASTAEGALAALGAEPAGTAESAVETHNADTSAHADIRQQLANLGAIPEYVVTEAETVARLVNQHQSGNSIVFPFLSDAHCGYYEDKTNEAAKLAGQLLDQIGKRVPFDFIANGGDMSSGAWNTYKTNAYDEIEDYTELTSEAHRGTPGLWCIGNHDDAPYRATADRLTQTETFALYGRKNRVSGAICPDGCNYGYLDLESQKMRVIVLDTHDRRGWGSVDTGAGVEATYLNVENIGGNQLRWLAETALDFTDKSGPAEWGVVVISHAALTADGTWTDPVDSAVYDVNTANAATILAAYQAGKSGSITHNGITVSYDFSDIESRAGIICCVHGHNHKFCDETVSGILSIGCPNVMNGRERESADGNTYAKTAGTADGTSFCILTIDRENCVIYADCVGVGYDREFTYTTEVVSYTNQIPISTDASGNPFGTNGLKEGYYLSSGNESAMSGRTVTGFIPFGTLPAVVRFKNVGFDTTDGYCRMCIYNSSYGEISTIKGTNAVNALGATTDENGNVTQFTIAASHSTYKYFRICGDGLSEDSIITINEPIE